MGKIFGWQIRGRRFVEEFYAAQFGLPEAIVELRNIKKENKQDVLISPDLDAHIAIT